MIDDALDTFGVPVPDIPIPQVTKLKIGNTIHSLNLFPSELDRSRGVCQPDLERVSLSLDPKALHDNFGQNGDYLEEEESDDSVEDDEGFIDEDEGDYYDFDVFNDY